jgi:hypothetical protein
MTTVARGFNTVVAITWKTFIACLLGPAVLYFDIAAGANYFGEAFKPYVDGTFAMTLPFIGWSFNWSYAAILAFTLSAVTSAIQIVLWNLSKTNIKGSNLSPQAIFAIVAAVALFILDFASDLGGATLWLSNTTDGRLWPVNANMFQAITIPVIVIAGVANEALLEFFYGIDKPQETLEKLRSIKGGKSGGQQAA